MIYPETQIVDRYFPVLDDGFIALKSFMGSDEDIERSARVSYGAGTRKKSDTRNLLRYLLRNRHTSPFEFPQLSFHIRAPIYIYRQWHRHRTWSYNEYSARYSIMIDSMEETKPDKWRLQSTTNKQGSEDGELRHPEGRELPISPSEYLSAREAEVQKVVKDAYDERLEYGVAREQARKDMPVSNYSEMYATVDLHNLLHFMSLRCDSHAQLEIRMYANIIAGMVKELFPLTFEAWYDYTFQSVNFTRLDREFLTKLLKLKTDYADISYWKNTDSVARISDDVGFSKRELDEFWEKVSVPSPQDFSLNFENSFVKNEDS